MDFGDADNTGCRVEKLIHFGFVVELWVFGGSFFQLGCILFRRIVLIFSEIDLPKCAGTQLADKFKMIADNKIWILLWDYLVFLFA